ncbi:hypothetical protein Btru_053723 [Bulinus truncatus]|nr:hypothetical protein Btru_053723 [Bulinus truncatus]
MFLLFLEPIFKRFVSNMTDANVTHAAGLSPLAINLITLNSYGLTLFVSVIGLLGIYANAVNILVLRRQGYQDGVNISLTALAVSDIGAAFCQETYIVLSNPWVKETDLIMLKSHLFNYLVYYRQYFVRVSCLITSFAAFERCLCVVLPLRIRTVITVKAVVTVNGAIFLVLTLYFVPPHYLIYIDWKFIPQLNKTILGFYYRDNIISISYYFTDMFLPYGTFAFLIVCSSVIYLRLRYQAKWRQSFSRASLVKTASCKDRKSATMLLTVSVLCVVLVMPQSLLFTAVGLVRELKVDGAYWSVSQLIYSFTSLLETINGSIAIFVYYNMRYRDQFKKVFSKANTLRSDVTI